MFANSVFITPGRFIERAFAEYFSRLLSNIQSELSRVPGSNKLSIENQTLQWLTRFYNALELFTTSTKEHTALTHSYQWRIQGRGPGNPAPPPTPSFLDQTKARRAEKKFFWDGPPPFSQGLDGRPPPSSPYLKICIRHWLFLKSKLCYALHGLHLSLAAAVIVRDLGSRM